MAQSTTGKKVTARERARLAIAEGMAEELREQERIAAVRESATTRFFEAEDRREALEAELVAIDTERGGAVLELDALGMKTDKVATLLGIPEGDIRRLRKTSPIPDATGDSNADQSAGHDD